MLGRVGPFTSPYPLSEVNMEIWVRMDSAVWEELVEQGFSTMQMEERGKVTWARMERVLRDWPVIMVSSRFSLD